MKRFVREDSYGLEVVFLLLIYYALYGTSVYFEPIATASPIGPNYILIAIIAIYVAIRAVTRPIRVQTLIAIGLFAVFAAYYTSTILWSESTAYASWKTLRLVSVISLLFVGCALYFNGERNRLERFYLIAVVAAGLLVIDVIYTLAILGYGTPPYLDINYILVSRPLGVGVILATYFAIITQRRVARIALSGGAFILFFGMLQSGARGPLLALIAALGVFAGWLYLRFDISVTRPQLAVASVGSLVGVGILATTAGTTVERLIQLVRWDNETSGAGRVDLLVNGVQYWINQPLIGHGIGSFPVLYSGEDERYYPHNIVLEIGIEAGLIGVVLFALFSGYCLWIALRSDTDQILVGAAVTLYVYLLANAMVTGDISTNRMLFAATALLLVADTSEEIRIVELIRNPRSSLSRLPTK